MDNPRFRHLKRSVFLCFAIALALAGTAYASVKVTQHHLAGITCGGSCPAKTVYWTYINATGVPGSLSPGTTVNQTALGGVPAQVVKNGVGSWTVYFSGKNVNNCARIANLTSIRGSATVGAYGTNEGSTTDPTGIPVLTTDAQGNPVDTNFVVVALCGGGQGATLAVSGG